MATPRGSYVNSRQRADTGEMGPAEGGRPRRGGQATPRESCVNSRQRVDTGEMSQGRPNGGFVVWGGDQNPSGAAHVFMIAASHYPQAWPDTINSK